MFQFREKKVQLQIDHFQGSLKEWFYKVQHKSKINKQTFIL